MNNLSLLTGADIPFPEGRLVIHQPTIKEIGFIGENTFFLGCGFLSFSKDILSDGDKSRLEEIDDFNILMSIMIGKNIDANLKENVDSAQQVLLLLFPNNDITFEAEQIKIGEGFINKNNFVKFKEILKEMFQLSFKNDSVQKEYKPANDAAAAIVEKLKKRHEKLAQLNGTDSHNIQIFGRYMSIISTYQGISYLDLAQYTVFQLYDIFSRIQLKMAYDMAIQAKMAGAKDVKNPEDWMKDLYKK